MFQLTNEQRVFIVEQKYAPDLSPLDYFLRGHVKEKVFQSEPSYVTALKQAIRKVISSIQQDVLTAVSIRNVQKRVDLYIELKSGHFEHCLQLK